MSALLAFGNATVGYGETPVVSGATLEISPGEVVGLVGPNGAGKSTLLKAVTGEARLISGAIGLEGRSLADFTARERARVVGVVPQQVIAEFSFPAEEFVAMGRHAHLARFAAAGEFDRAAVERAMSATDTLHLAGRPIDALSGGDLQRLSFAQALAQEPRLLLLDEPTSHLDLNHRLQVLDLVRSLAEGGLGVLAVFHDLDLAARYSDRIAVVSGGALSQADVPVRVIDAEMLRTVFAVRAVVGTDPVTGSVSVTPVLREGAVAAMRRGRVHVIGGSGVAAPLLRRLVLAGWEVTCGALNLGDADATVAEALGIEFVAIPPFAPMDGRALAEASALARSADAVVVCDVPFGNGNLGNLAAAIDSGRPLVLVGGITGRDYTGGKAEELWTAALASGARTVGVAEQVDSVLVTLSSGTTT